MLSITPQPSCFEPKKIIFTYNHCIKSRYWNLPPFGQKSKCPRLWVFPNTPVISTGIEPTM